MGGFARLVSVTTVNSRDNMQTTTRWLQQWSAGSDESRKGSATAESSSPIELMLTRVLFGLPAYNSIPRSSMNLSSVEVVSTSIPLGSRRPATFFSGSGKGNDEGTTRMESLTTAVVEGKEQWLKILTLPRQTVMLHSDDRRLISLYALCSLTIMQHGQHYPQCALQPDVIVYLTNITRPRFSQRASPPATTLLQSPHNHLALFHGHHE
jgi:hypothetical protein